MAALAPQPRAPRGPAPRRPAGRRPAQSRPAQSRPAADRTRRRRVQHVRRLRRDLLEDVGLGLVLTLVALILSAGLGMLAILELPVLAAVAGSFVAERVIRRRRAYPPRRAGRLRM